MTGVFDQWNEKWPEDIKEQAREINALDYLIMNLVERIKRTDSGEEVQRMIQDLQFYEEHRRACLCRWQLSNLDFMQKQLHNLNQ